MNEADLIKLLDNTSVLDCVALQLEEFTQAFNIQPEMIFISMKTKSALIKELIITLGVSPGNAVQEPIWLDNIPILFARELGDHYITIANRRHGKVLSL